MPFSQNGYTAGNENLLTHINIPGGGRLRVRKGPVAVVFQYLVDRFAAEVEPIYGPVLDDWGYAFRDIRGGTALSNHASGTAIDLNAIQHPMGKHGTFAPHEAAAIRAILRDLDGVVRWGGDYSGRPDEQHFEINASSARVTAVAARLQEDVVQDADIQKIIDGVVARLPKEVWRYDQDGATDQAWAFQKNIESIVDNVVEKRLRELGWGYRNPSLEKVDAYQILRDVRNAVKPPVKAATK